MRILLADDHQLVRAGLRPFLMELADTVEVVEAESYPDAVRVAEDGDVLPAMAVLDLRMPGLEDGGLAGFCEAFSEVPVVVLSGSVTPEDVWECVRSGAAGYVPKIFGGPAMLAALRLVLAGERFFPAFSLDAALQKRGSGLGFGPPEGEESDGEGAPLRKLSARERDILNLMIDGGTNKEIARELDVQEITVKVHLRNIYRKLGAANRAQAVRIALENGWQTQRESLGT